MQAVSPLGVFFLALETEALFMRRAVRAGVLDVDKGTAALYVFSQLKQMGATFSFGQFLVERGLLSNIALSALEEGSRTELKKVDTVGDYQLIELIGEGQNGAVFRALQKSLNRHVALKILSSNISSDPAALERFQREARTTAKLNHPNVVQGIDVGSDQGLHYFSMELIDGGSARSLLESADGMLDEATCLNIIREAAEGLRAAHSAGLLHRDLKPDNILLTQEGHAKLADLGISQNVGNTENDPGGEFWASPPYVPPEVIQGTGQGDPRSDIYSLGATLFELLAGRPPYVADSAEDVMHMHMHEAIPDIQSYRPDVSVQTASLLKRMLAKEIEERVPSAQSVVDAVTRIIAMKHQMASQPPVPPPAPPPPQQRRLTPYSGSGRPGFTRPGARPTNRPKPRPRR